MKSTSSVPSNGSKKTGARKVAVLMLSLGVETSSALLKHLGPSEIETVGECLSALGSVGTGEADEVLREFEDLATRRQVVGFGGPDYARQLLNSTFGEEYVRRAGIRMPGEPQRAQSALEVLSDANPEQLALLLENEKPQTIAVLLSRLDPDRASGIVSSLSGDRQSDVLARLAALDQSDSAMVELIASDIQEKLAAVGSRRIEYASGVQLAADVINRLDPQTGERALQTVEAQSPELAESIRHLLFVFDDILKLDAKTMRELLSRIDRKLLEVGLKGTSEEVKQHFFNAMSKNGVAMLLEDMEVSGPVRLREVESAQREIISAVRQMETEGLLDLRTAGVEEYVV